MGLDIGEVDTQLSWMERSLGPRGARALLAAAGSAVVALSIPAALLEHGLAASGIGGLVPVFAAPIGIGMRCLFAILAALAAAALVWAFWGIGDGRGRMRDMHHMPQARRRSGGLSWGALMRRVRGISDDPGQAVLARRRRDRHPDAPPRPPLFASRDLPAFDGAGREASAIEALAPVPVPEMQVPEIQAPEMQAPEIQTEIAPPVVIHSEPVFDLPDLPRSPPPMSEEEIAEMLAARPDMAASSAAPCAAMAPVPAESASGALVDSVRKLDLPLIEGADLATLSARFEDGLARRQLVHAADQAQSVLDERLVYMRFDPSVRSALRAQRPVGIVPGMSPDALVSARLTDGNEHVDVALDQALATLRRLTEQGRR